MIKIGDEVKGSSYYGRKNTLIGKVTKIKEVIYKPQSLYRGMDIITVEWNNGTIAKFHRENWRYN